MRHRMTYELEQYSCYAFYRLNICFFECFMRIAFQIIYFIQTPNKKFPWFEHFLMCFPQKKKMGQFAMKYAWITHTGVNQSKKCLALILVLDLVFVPFALCIDVTLSLDSFHNLHQKRKYACENTRQKCKKRHDFPTNRGTC